MPPPIPRPLTQLQLSRFKTTFRTLPALTPLIQHRTVAGGPQKTQPFKIWPFLVILALGSGSYMYMVKSRAEHQSQSPRKGPRNNSPGLPNT